MGKIPVSKMLASLVAISLVLSSCQKKIDEKDQFAKVNGKVISNTLLESYKRAKSMYPANTMGKPFPAYRKVSTVAINVETMYKKANKAVGSEIKGSLDWQWKQRYYIAQSYMIDIISKNWGYTDDEVKAFYDNNIDKFSQTVKTKGDDSASTKDSTFTVPFERVQPKAAMELFKSKNEPDSLFKVDFIKNGANGELLDAWVGSIAKNKPDYFMKKIYEKKFDKAYPDSLNELLGADKIIGNDDFDVILSWIPEKDRERFSTADQKRSLVEWLLKWKLFEEEAKNAVFDKKESVKDLLKAAERYEIVLSYINNELFNEKLNKVNIDLDILKYQNWDRTGVPGVELNEVATKNLVDAAKKTKASIMLEAELYKSRVAANTEILSERDKDGKVKAPEEIQSEIDSILNVGSDLKPLKKLYKTLSEEFAFTSIGQNAILELAKIKTEDGNYKGAIKSYRRYLTITNDQEKRCNVFFMIGYIYGENLSKYKLAEANYKWILRNTPGCELADDAEFMVLHLGEPMIEVEELQAESKRQGKSIE